MTQITKDDGPVVQPIFKAESSTDPAELDKLADSQGYDADSIRMSVAQNPHTSTETLDRLAEDPYTGTRWAVAQNPNTSPETLDHLTRDLDAEVMDMAENVTLRRCEQGPEHVAARWKKLATGMSQDYKLEQEGRSAKQPTQAQFDAGQRLTERRYDRRRQHYALTTSSKVLIDEFLMGGNATLRWMCARNPHTSPSQLINLERDARRPIAMQAFKRLHAVKLIAISHKKDLNPAVSEYLHAPGWKQAQMEEKDPHLVERILGTTLEEDVKFNSLTQPDRPLGQKKPKFVKAR